MRTTLQCLLSRLMRQAVYASALLTCLVTPAVAQSTLQYVPVITNYGGLATTVCSAATDSVGDGCPAIQAKFAGPVGALADGAGNLYISDGSSNVIRRIDAVTGIITQVAGGASAVCATATDTVGDGCPATQVTFSAPKGLKFDPYGNLIIADSNNHRIRSLNLQTGIVTTIAGTGVQATSIPSNSKPLPANQTPLAYPYDTAFDVQGNMYIVNYKGSSFVSVVAAVQGAIIPGTSLEYTLAGTGTNGAVGVPGLATAGQVSGPHGVEIDAGGNLYIACYTDDTVRKITSPLVNGVLNVSASTMTIFAGQSGVAAPAGAPTTDGGSATLALLAGAQSAVLDKAGNLYPMQASGSVNRIAKISPSGIINSYAGLSGTKDTTGTNGARGPALSAEMGGPTWGNFDAFGHLFVTAQYSFNVYSISSSNRFLQTSVGSTSAAQNLAVQATRTLTLTSATVAPSTPSEFTIGTLSGCLVGGSLASNAYCTLPVTFKPTLPGVRTAQLTVADSNANVSVIGLTGIGSAPEVAFEGATLSTIAGTGTAGNANPAGPAISAQLNAPRGGVFDAAGDLYFADSDNHEVRRIDHSTFAISTVAGTGTAGFSGDTGAATSAKLNTPENLMLDAAGNLYIADTGNDCIRYVDAVTGIITTIAGTGTAGYTGDGGLPTAATLNAPQGLALDGAGLVYVADTGNHALRRFSPGSAISTIAGNGIAGYDGDGGPAGYAHLNSPAALAFDLVGNLFIADMGNSVVRKISTLGQISTYAGQQSKNQNTGDGGAATAAALQSPSSIALDPAGDLYIASGGEVRMVDTTGLISTIAGTGATGSYSGEGGPATNAVLPAPVSNLALDASANLYLFATAANRVLMVASASAPSMNFVQAKSATVSTPQSLTIQNAGNSPLTLSNISLSTGFTLQTPLGNACSATLVLSPGGSCVFSIVFSSATTGVFHGTLTLSDNALNAAGATQTVPLSGQAGVLTSTTTALSITPSTASYGSAVTLTATVSGSSSPTGTVSFTANGKPLGDSTLSGGSAALTLSSLGAGSYSISATYSGDTNNATSVSNGLSQVIITPTTLTVTAVNATRQGGDSNPAFAYTVTGFVNGESASVISGTPLETSIATQTSVAGTYPITIAQGTLTAANYVFIFINGTLTVTAPVPDFAIASSATSMSVSSGQAGTTTITLTPLHTFAGTVTLGCSNLPAHVICTFNTTQLTTDNTFTPQSTQLTIATDSLSQIADGTSPAGTLHAYGLAYAMTLPFFSIGIFLLRRRHKTGLASLLSICLMCMLPLFPIGCSSSTKALAAPGTYNITVTATNSTQSVSHNITIALTVK